VLSLLPVAGVVGALASVFARTATASSTALSLAAIWALLMVSFLVEWRAKQLDGRPRRIVAYSIALWGGAYLPLAAAFGTFFGPLPVRLIGFPVAALGWLPVGWLSLSGDQPALSRGRANPFLFAAIWAGLAAVIAYGY